MKVFKFNYSLTKDGLGKGVELIQENTYKKALKKFKNIALSFGGNVYINSVEQV